MSEQQVDPLDNPEVNQAAATYMNSIKQFKNYTGRLPKKSLEKVFDAVMEFPLAGTEPKLRNKTEHQVFLLALNILANKNIMMQAIIKDQTLKQSLLVDAQKSLTDTEENVTVTETVEGEVNG